MPVATEEFPPVSNNHSHPIAVAPAAEDIDDTRMPPSHSEVKNSSAEEGHGYAKPRAGKWLGPTEHPKKQQGNHHAGQYEGAARNVQFGNLPLLVQLTPDTGH